MKIVININQDEAREAIAKHFQGVMGVTITADDVEVRTYEGFRITVDQWPPKQPEPIPAPPVMYSGDFGAQAVPVNQELEEHLKKLQAMASGKGLVDDPQF